MVSPSFSIFGASQQPHVAAKLHALWWMSEFGGSGKQGGHACRDEVMQAIGPINGFWPR